MTTPPKYIRDEVIKYCVGNRVNEVPVEALPSIIEDIRQTALHDMQYQTEVVKTLRTLLHSIAGYTAQRPRVSIIESIFGPSKQTIEELVRYEAAQTLADDIERYITELEQTIKPMKWAEDVNKRFLQK